jgi:hypothetical protein
VNDIPTQKDEGIWHGSDQARHMASGMARGFENVEALITEIIISLQLSNP